ncbi:helix-turn-helix domain-containing protein [Candidatus Micrarchaeota archaeon]|nr:helix-turn-helix domain-containing protein [Candidatus Micrarchaeota archaeon]
MNMDELLGLIRTGEGYTLELKEKLPSDLGKQFCAFANASGGRIILGVKDDGTASGYGLTNHDEASINATARNLEPSLRITVEKVGNFVVIHVPEGESKPYSSGGHFYLRVGSTAQQLKRDEIREFFLKERLVRFDEKPNMDFDFKNDFDEKKFRDYLDKAGISPVANVMDMLRNLELIDGGYMKNAGALLFSKKITHFFTTARVVCVLYQGTDKYTIIDKREFGDDLLSDYENAFNYLRSKLNTNYIIKAERTNRLELPENALREALVNALVHRDYFSNGHVQVDIYLDRVDVSNPGGLVHGLAKEDFGKRSMPRNPLLMDLFMRIDKVEKAGTGIKRICDAMKKYGLTAKFDINENWFSIVFPRVMQGATTQKTVEKGVEKTVEKILGLIRKNPRITQKELMTETGLTRRGVEWNLSKLKNEGKLKRIGPDKGGYWEINEE